MFGSNARLGEGKFLVAEADESDRSFLKLFPIVAVVTNIEEEHMDCYRDLDDILDTFVQFMNKVPFFGFNMVCLDNENIQHILPRLERKVITYGYHNQALYRYTDTSFDGLTSKFIAHRNGSTLGEVRLNVPGNHNCLNALAVIGTCIELEIDFDVVRKGSRRTRASSAGPMSGAKRTASWSWTTTATTPRRSRKRSARSRGVPEPAARGGVPAAPLHQDPGPLRRLRHLVLRCAEALHHRYLCGIRAAHRGVSAKSLCEEISAHGHRDVHYVEDKEAIPQALMDDLKQGDLVLFLGAGDAWRQGLKLLEMIG
jgi:UDP-N-acetylmuramate--alanine ligase